MIDKKDVERIYGNLCQVPLWNATLNAKEVEYLFGMCRSGTLYCLGHLRELKVDKITDNLFKVFTKRWNG